MPVSFPQILDIPFPHKLSVTAFVQELSKPKPLVAAARSYLLTTTRHYRGLDISLLVYPRRPTATGYGHNYEEGFDASIRISEPDSAVDIPRSRVFRVPGLRPFANAGDARRASVAFAEMLIDRDGSDRTIWELVSAGR